MVCVLPWLAATGWGVKVTAYLEDQDYILKDIKCSFTIKAVNGGSMATGAAALGVVSAIALIMYKRRRTTSTASINLLAEERKAEAEGQVEMISERGVVV